MKEITLQELHVLYEGALLEIRHLKADKEALQKMIAEQYQPTEEVALHAYPEPSIHPITLEEPYNGKRQGVKIGTLGVPLLLRREPTKDDHADPRFEVLWELIKRVDVDYRNGMFSGATGNDVCAVLDALDIADALIPKKEPLPTVLTIPSRTLTTFPRLYCNICQEVRQTYSHQEGGEHPRRWFCCTTCSTRLQEEQR